MLKADGILGAGCSLHPGTCRILGTCLINVCWTKEGINTLKPVLWRGGLDKKDLLEIGVGKG